ncbi:MAG: glycosyl hydrolase family 28-related protein [Candidatus Sumerlaeia bacterium]|nr:glycosyl hydrolase family 28-related protein [Candidatus Sumerlaeia bacterium]
MDSLVIRIGMVAAALAFSPLLPAQGVTFPAGSRIVDVTQPPYNAVGDGVTDCTSAINQALFDHPDGNCIIYLPDGTYLISDTLVWGIIGGNPSLEQSSRYTTLQGQSRTGTTIRLADNAPLFQNPAAPRGMINTGTGVAQRFRNAIHDLTVDAGVGNPGAIGIQFKANNQGGIFNTTVKAPSGVGVYGIDFSYSNEIGPLLLQDVLIDGFQEGIRTFFTVNSITMERVTVQNQTFRGMTNNQQTMFLRQFTSNNEVVAIFNTNQNSSMTLIDSTLVNPLATGGAAIINEDDLFIRNLTTSGYTTAVANSAFLPVPSQTGPNVAEMLTHGALRLCDSPETSLNLPVQNPPAVPWGDPATEWVNIDTFGATLVGGDDTAAIQAAMDATGTAPFHTVFVGASGQFPASYTMNSDVTVPATVKRIIGTEGRIGGAGRFIIEGNTTDPLAIERFGSFGSAIVHNSNRPVVIKHMVMDDYEPGPSAGDAFIEDVVMGTLTIRNQRLWARQLNIERGAGETSILNDGGDVWILGYKTERRGTKIRTINGGNTEVLGAFFYSTDSDTPEPMFVVEDSNMTVAGLKETNFSSDPYSILVREIRNGETRDFTGPTSGGLGGAGWSLYASFRPSGPNSAPTVSAGRDQSLVGAPAATSLSGAVNDDGLPSGSCFATRIWSKQDGPGNVTFGDPSAEATTANFDQPGVYTLRLTVDDGEFSTSDDVVVAVFDRAISTFDHDSDSLASGNGADARVTSNGDAGNNFGGLVGIRARFNDIFASVAYVRFDVSDLQPPTEHAEFSLEISTTNTGLISPWTFNVFGLVESPSYGAGELDEFWLEGAGTGTAANPGEITWNNAPGLTGGGGAYDSIGDTGGGVDPAHTDFLGTFTLRQGVREVVRMRSAALADFLNADTNGVATLIVTRVDFTANSIDFASKEQGTFAAPTLSIVRDRSNVEDWTLLD